MRWITFGYRHAETVFKLLAGDIPDASYSLKHTNFKDRVRRPMRVSLGCHLVGAAEPVPDTSHGPSQCEANIKRVSAAMPPINRAKLRRLKRFVVRTCQQEFAGKQFSPEENFDFDEWIKQAPYTQERKRVLIDTKAESYSSYCKKMYNVKSHTKNESYPSYKAFRLICSRSDEYKCEVGPFFQKLGDIVFQNEHFIKKTPVEERPQALLDMFKDKVHTFFTDYSSFEATFVRELMVIERGIYAWFLEFSPHKDRLMKLFDQGIFSTNHIVLTDWAFSVLMKRMSGEMNTSVGNGLMNMFMTFFILEESGAAEYDGKFEGDDGATWYLARNHGHSKPPTEQDYLDIGAKIKIIVPDEPTLESFCGLIFDPDVLDNVTEPLSSLMSFGYTTDQYINASDDKLSALLKSKALSMLYSYPGSPIHKSLALYGLRVTKHIDDDYMKKVCSKTYMNAYEREELSLNERRKDRYDEMLAKPIHNKTRLIVERKFGVSVEMQKYIENYLDGLETLQPLNIPMALDHIHQDCLDYYERYGQKYDRGDNTDFADCSTRQYKIFSTSQIFSLF